jgi:trans-aconitate 2-methyltransferase
VCHLKNITFEVADLAKWRPARPTDLLFANAVFQRVPDHLSVLRQLTEALPAGGILAVEIPDNLGEPAQAIICENAKEGPWAAKLAGAEAARESVPAPAIYYNALRPLCQYIDMWHTIYHHALSDAAAIVEWMMRTALRPYLAPLDAAERQMFLATYTARIASAYPPLDDGRVLFRFPRFFLIAVKA